MSRRVKVVIEGVPTVDGVADPHCTCEVERGEGRTTRRADCAKHADCSKHPEPSPQETGERAGECFKWAAPQTCVTKSDPKACDACRGRGPKLAPVPETTTGETCGSFGCVLPAGHNRGKADVPSNHRPAPAADTPTGETCTCPEDEFLSPSDCALHGDHLPNQFSNGEEMGVPENLRPTPAADAATTDCRDCEAGVPHLCPLLTCSCAAGRGVRDCPQHAADVAGDEHQGEDGPDETTRRLHDAWNRGYQARDGQKPYTSNPWKV